MMVCLRKKLCFIVLTAGFAVAVLCAQAFVFTHIDHDHSGADCAVCLQIEIVQCAFKGFALALIAASLAAFIAAANQMIKKTSYYVARLFTPVTLNIKSNT
jgi:hypothetical protein